ncbi:MAG: helix-turn-helix domain-containing protein [Hominilimicola sp.]|uniref:helix-turn-helix domain-containing protein n=1 Tax=Hominilimicola sp. TaxID=3073571 RepID=UPI00399BB81F
MIKYYKLLDVLNRREMTKEELRIKLNLSSATIAKISKNEFISLRVINDICKFLNCQPGDIMEYVPDKNNL